MKVQIIYLDPHDDQISARDKLKWAQTSRVALVWPKEAKILCTQIDLALLRHHAQRLGRQLTLVTQDPTVRRNAHRVGFPVADSLSDLPEDDWPSHSPTFPPLPGGRVDIWKEPTFPPTERRPAALEGRWGDVLRRITIGFITFTVLAVIVLLLPSSSIVLRPGTNPALMTISFHLDPLNCPKEDQACIPTQQVELRMQQDSRMQTTGLVRVPETAARGEAVFTNLTGRPLEIPAGTGVRPTGSQNLRFLTTGLLELEADIGATGRVEIVAAQPGSQGNLPAGSINAIEGPLGLNASVSNPVPLTGGREAIKHGVSASDIDQLRRDLERALIDQARTAITDSLGPSQRLAADSLRIIEVLEQGFNPAAGNASESLSGRLDARLTALTYDQTEFHTAAYRYVESRLHEKQRVVPGSMGLLQTGPVEIQGDGSALLRAHAQFETYRHLDFPGLISTIRGKTPEEARGILEGNYDLVVQEIHTIPGWFPWISWVPSRIQISLAWRAG